jgi:hypothetical protein
VGSLVRFLIFATALAAVVVFVIVPLVGGPIVSSMLRQAGLDGQGVNVSLDLLGPSILSGRAESVRVTAENVNVPHGTVGQMDLTLKDVSVSSRDFTSVSGTLHDVRLTAPDGSPVVVDTVNVSGPATRARASGMMNAADARHLVQTIATKAGLSADAVQLGNGQVSIKSGTKTTQARLRVAGRALVLDQGGNSTVLVAPAPSEHWELEGVTVTPAGIQVDLNVDAQALASELSSQVEGASAPPPSASPVH